VYESYTGQPDGSGSGLDLFLIEIGDGAAVQAPYRLTEEPGADRSPSWSPDGRKIAFVSDRTGDDEIWLADLDLVDNRFVNLSQRSQTQESHPAWSPDGGALAWVTSVDGIRSIYLWKAGGTQPGYTGSGEWPAWSPDGQAVSTSLATPNGTYLTGYTAGAGGLVLPPLALNGSLAGLTWGKTDLPHPLAGPFAEAAALTPAPAWQPVLTPGESAPSDRQRLAPLADVQTSFAFLHDMVDESFIELRAQVSALAGWDFLGSLENAYIPLTKPLFPGMAEDWLYTGRAFSFNTAPVHAGWVILVREDFGPATYWRVYLRTRFQDGTQGMPLHHLPWNFNSRSSGDALAYEQGGVLSRSMPPGYWLDFTQLAASYGWERMPALSTWRFAYQAARYNEFAITGGLDWQSAMQELYPSEALSAPSQPANLPAANP
jgi:TolB protein